MIASKEAGACHGKLGGTEQATIAMRDVKISDYNRCAFIGGPGAGAYAEDPDALKVARDAAASEMPLGAICIAPTILAKAGVLKGKKATVWDDGEETQINLLKDSGALYSGEDVTVDGLIVTANGPEAAEKFGRTFGQLAVGN